MTDSLPGTLRSLALRQMADPIVMRAAADRIEALQQQVERLRGDRAADHSHLCNRCHHPYTPRGADEDCPMCGYDGEDASVHLKDPVVIYSGEHRAYWGPECSGYVDLRRAGWYERSDALRLTRGCGPEKRIEIQDAQGAVRAAAA